MKSQVGGTDNTKGFVFVIISQFWAVMGVAFENSCTSHLDELRVMQRKMKSNHCMNQVWRVSSIFTSH